MLSLGAPALAAQDITFRVVIPDSQPRLAQVDVTLPAKNDTIGFSSFGASQFPEGWRKFVTKLDVRDERGAVIATTPLPNGKWLAPGAGGHSIRLRYDVFLSHDRYVWQSKKNEAAYGEEWGVFYLGRALFATGGNAALPDTVNVSFTLPRDWQIDTQWEPFASDPHTFRVPRPYLWASGIVMGHYERREVLVGNTRAVHALGGLEPHTGSPQLEENTRELLEQYASRFGALPIGGRVLYVIGFDSTFDGRAGAGVVGRTITQLAPMRRIPDGAHGGLLRTMAHEYQHLWNGWTIGTAGVNEEWFKEGVTEYYSTLTIRRLAKTTDEQFLARLREHLGHYLAYAGREPPSAQGERKGSDDAIVYSGGLAIGLALDLEIRERTNGARSLDDFMRLAMTRREPFTNADLLTGLQKATGIDFSEFFARHVTGREVIPVETYLAKAGIEVVRGATPAATAQPDMHGGGPQIGIARLPRLARAAHPTAQQESVWSAWVKR